MLLVPPDCPHSSTSPQPTQLQPLLDGDIIRVVQACYTEWISEQDYDTLIALSAGASYLGIPALLNLCVTWLASAMISLGILDKNPLHPHYRCDIPVSMVNSAHRALLQKRAGNYSPSSAFAFCTNCLYYLFVRFYSSTEDCLHTLLPNAHDSPQTDSSALTVASPVQKMTESAPGNN